jgi:AcrR family transcriptional regulator
MSRTADAQLKDRILDVAQGLLRAQGEKGVTLRAVADAAGTTTPTVYKRFEDKAAILVALALRERERYVKRVAQRRTLRSAAEGYLDWAIQHPHEYQLMHGPHWHRVFTEENGRPGREWAQEQLAVRHGGRPEEYALTATTLWLILHGAASMLVQESAGPAAKEIREQCLVACDRVIENAAKFRQ